MYEVKVIKGMVNVFENNLLMLRLGAGDIIHADINHDQTMVLITYAKGHVELRNIDGRFIRTVGNGDALKAKWLGNHITVVRKCGKADLRRMNNFIPRLL